MSAKTKIVVLHMKELIYTGIFAVLGILFVVLLVMMFLPDKEESPQPDAPTGTESPSGGTDLPGETSPASDAECGSHGKQGCHRLHPTGEPE